MYTYCLAVVVLFLLLNAVSFNINTNIHITDPSDVREEAQHDEDDNDEENQSTQDNLPQPF